VRLLALVLCAMTGVAAAKPARRSPEEQAARVKVAEALFVEGMRRFLQGGCVNAIAAFEQAYAERPGGRHEVLAKRWVERCRKELGQKPPPQPAPGPVDPYAVRVPPGYEDLDSGPGGYVARAADPYADLDGPPQLGLDEPSLE
jgi:hypothetical protein